MQPLEAALAREARRVIASTRTGPVRPATGAVAVAVSPQHRHPDRPGARAPGTRDTHLEAVTSSCAASSLVNPPLVGGIAFTRQGRCQEREEVLGTTKPPYTLVLVGRAAARRAACDVPRSSISPPTSARSRRSSPALQPSGFTPDADRVPEHDADARRRRGRDGQAQGGVRRAARSASVRTRPARAGRVDGARARSRRRWSSASPRTRSSRWRCAAVDRPRTTMPSLTLRRDGRSCRTVAHGSFTGFLDDAVSRVGPARPVDIPAAPRRQPLRDRRDQPRVSVLVRLLRRADPPGAQVPRADAPRRSSTRSSAATASSASSSSTSGATRSRSTRRRSARSARS